MKVDLRREKPPWMKRIGLSNPAHPGHKTHAISTDGRRAERIWNPDFLLPDQLASKLTAQCVASNKELCGFITDDFDAVYVDNVHLEPRHNYYMHPEQVVNAVKTIYEDWDSEILGQFHTHPNCVPWPSPRDLMGWPNPQLNWHYWIVTHTEVIEWELIVPKALPQ